MTDSQCCRGCGYHVCSCKPGIEATLGETEQSFLDAFARHLEVRVAAGVYPVWGVDLRELAPAPPYFGYLEPTPRLCLKQAQDAVRAGKTVRAVSSNDRLHGRLYRVADSYLMAERSDDGENWVLTSFLEFTTSFGTAYEVVS